MFAEGQIVWVVWSNDEGAHGVIARKVKGFEHAPELGKGRYRVTAPAYSEAYAYVPEADVLATREAAAEEAIRRMRVKVDRLQFAILAVQGHVKRSSVVKVSEAHDLIVIPGKASEAQ